MGAGDLRFPHHPETAGGYVLLPRGGESRCHVDGVPSRLDGVLQRFGARAEGVPGEDLGLKRGRAAKRDGLPTTGRFE